ncbi:MAG: hypothetical protein ACREL5_03225 [Gemmatimonadales bacterium]
MHIELTDHLRCPRDHDEAYLVLLPDRMDHRRVIAGHLGCPICGWNTSWTDAIPDFGGGWSAEDGPPFDAAGAAAMLGLGGPGGLVALAGAAGALAPKLAELLHGVAIVAINPPAAVQPSEEISVLRSGAWPLKEHSMRGVVLGADAGRWRDQAIATTLPGLRTIASGDPPSGAGIELLAHAGGIWVVRHR